MKVEVKAIERGHDGTTVRDVGEQFYVDENRLKDGSTWFVPVEEVKPDDGGFADPEVFLSRTIPEITDDLPALNDDELDKYLTAEKDGKARVGLIEAIEREQQSREQ